MAGSGMTAAFRLLLDGPTALKKIEDEHDHGQNQKDVDPSAQGVAADQADNPEEEEHDGDCPEHIV
jgi:hypothetical protein